MKKIIFGLIAIVSISNMSFGQATLEHSYTTNGWDFDDNYNSFKTQNGFNYFTFNKTTNILQLFDSNHTLFKTVNIPVPSGYTLSQISTFSDVLFNTDNLIEFMVSCISSTSTINRSLKLVNENGTIIQDFGNRFSAFITKNGTQFKLITYYNGGTQIPNVDYIFDVYSLPGTTLNVVTNLINEESFFGFPNPTSNIISITNNLKSGENSLLEVFDINGKKVMEKVVTGENNEIHLDVSDFSNGVYICRLNGETSKFIKK